MQAQSRGFPENLTAQNQIDQLQSAIDQLSTNLEKMDQSSTVYYNQQDGRVHSIGGEWLQSLTRFERNFLDATRLSKMIPTPLFSTGIQKIARMFSPAPNLTPITQDMKRKLEAAMQQAAVEAKATGTREGLQALQDRIEGLVKSLESTKVQHAFQTMIQSDANTAAELASLHRVIESSDVAIMEDLWLANLLNDDRLAVLARIAQAGGSLQAYDVLTHDEYSAIRILLEKESSIDSELTELEKNLLQRLPSEITNVFGNAIQSLDQRIADLQEKNPLFSDSKIREKAKAGFEEFQEIQQRISFLKMAKEEGKIDEGEFHRTLAELEAKKEELRPILNAIVDAKNFIREVLSEEGEGSWLDIFSFAQSDDPAYKLLSDIEAMSHYQSVELDQMINQKIWEEHLKNQPSNTPSLNALVEGAGPNGLFTGLLLFLAGSNVSIVNDRGERYVRNQIFDLDPKWAGQLRYFLGTKFDELFIGENAPGRYVEKGHYLQINTKNLEDALKERMTEIAAFAESKGQDPSPFRLFYEVALRDVHLPSEKYPHFSSHLEAPTRVGADAMRFNQSLIDAAAARLLNTKFKNLEPTDMILVEGERKPVLEAAYDEAKSSILESKLKGVLEFLAAKHQRDIDPDELLIDTTSGKKISAREQAVLEMEGKAPELRKIPALKFDFLVCCGGAGDPIRNQYLGIPKEETVPRSYGVGVMVKGDKFKNQNFLPEGKEGRFYESMAALKPHLEEQDFDSLIESSDFLSEGLRQKYGNLTAMILRGLVEDEAATQAAGGKPQYKMDGDGNYILGSENLEEHQIQLRMFENKLTFYTGAETADALSKFLEDLEKEMKILPPQSPEIAKYKELKSEIDRRWFAAIAYKYMTDGHPENEGIINMDPKKQDPEKINFDPVPINTGTFPVVQFALETAAKELHVRDKSLIVTATGDSRASPHFYSGSGMSTGRTGIENTAILVKDFHHGQMDRKTLVEQLDGRLDKVKLQVLEKGSHFVKRSPPEKKARIACKQMCDNVNQVCKLLTKKPIKGEHAYRIIRTEDVTPDHRQFQLEVKGVSGDLSIYNVEVGASGGLLINNERYETILDAVIALEKI